MPDLTERVEAFAADLTTIECCVTLENEVLAYSKIEAEGDAINYLARSADDAIIQLQQNQIEVSNACRGAMLGLTSAIIKSLIK